MGWPVYRKTGSASVSLYALSILPKTVVAARGLGNLPWTGLFVGTYVFLLVLSGLSDLIMPQSGGMLVWAFRNFVPVIFVVLLTWMVWRITEKRIVANRESMSARLKMSSQMNTENGYSSLNTFHRSTRRWDRWFVIYCVGLFAGVVYTSVVGRVNDALIGDSRNTILPGVSDWTLLLTLFIGFLYVSVGGVATAVQGEPRLPNVNITLSDADKTVVGKLLDHSGGTWHFFDEECRLKAIPDGQVKVAEVYEESDQHTANEA